MNFLQTFVLGLEKGLHCEVVLMDRWHLEVYVLVFNLSAFAEVCFRCVVFGGFRGFYDPHCGQADLSFAFLFVHLKIEIRMREYRPSCTICHPKRAKIIKKVQSYTSLI